jgi:hypothetical protein
LGYKVFYINITDNDTEIIENNYGLIKNIKSLEGIDTGFQSQVVRLYSSVLLKNKNLLMSDIDMMPLNGDYFRDKSDNIQDNKLLFYSGQPYANVPYFPMCYILGKGCLISELLEIEDSYTHFILKMCRYSNMDWNTDEKYIYNTIMKFDRLKKCEILRDRDYNRRINRSGDDWDRYDKELLKNGYFIDSHLLRPYNEFKEKINMLI